MIKQVVTFIGLAMLSSQSYAQVQSGSQAWECALDLHQGDKGTLSLNRSGDNLDGVISFTRNENVFESAVSGNWSGNEIDLIRLLDAGSTELMTGISVPLGTKKMNIGGRYSSDYHGVWSANCDLVSEASSVKKPEREQFTTTTIEPAIPTNKQQITFSVASSDPFGVKEISIFLGSEKIHSCSSSDCKFNYGPLPKGIYSWRVEALSNSGSESIESDRLTIKGRNKVNELVVGSPKVNNCRISGRATGSSAPLAQIYSVKLYGPDSKTILKASSGFDNGVYQFTDLAAGQYQLIIDTKADQDIIASPMAKILNCKAKSTLTQDISFN